MLRKIVAFAVTLIVLAGAHRASAEAVPATVRGVEAVNLRRGPGTESPAFRALARGTHLRVDEVNGQWARVTLDDGESGYINATYLQLEPGVTFPPAASTAVPPVNEPAAAADAASVTTPAEPSHTAALEGQLTQLRERLAALESAVVTPVGGVPAAGSAGGGETPRPLAPLPAPVAPPDQFDLAPSLALGGVGLLIGFLLGAVYGQRQERHRRSRVRF